MSDLELFCYGNYALAITHQQDRFDAQCASCLEREDRDYERSPKTRAHCNTREAAAAIRPHHVSCSWRKLTRLSHTQQTHQHAAVRM